jgi:hypothetical protein
VRRYLLFGWLYYDPLGGWQDFQGAWDTIEAAKAAAEKGFMGKVEIVDIVQGCLVWEGWRHEETATVSWERAIVKEG